MDDLISKTSVCEIIADIYPTDGEKVVAVKEIDKAYEAIQQSPSAQSDHIAEVGKKVDADLISRHDVYTFLDYMRHPKLAELIMYEECIPSAQPEQSDIKEMAVDIGYLRDWYQSSVLEDEWPDRYIEEVYHDFYLIPKQENEKNESDVDT